MSSISFLVPMVSILAYFEFLSSFWLIFLDGSKSVLFILVRQLNVWKFLRSWLKKQLLMPQNPLSSLVSKHYVSEKDDCRDPTAICCSLFPWWLSSGKWAAVGCALCRSCTSFSDDQGLCLPSSVLRATAGLTAPLMCCTNPPRNHVQLCEINKRIHPFFIKELRVTN